MVNKSRYQGIAKPKWAQDAVDNSEQSLLEQSRENYRMLFLQMINGYAYCKMVYDEENRPVDWVYLEINDAFEKITGLNKEDVIGKRVTKAIPGIKDFKPDLFQIYGKVASTGKGTTFEIHFDILETWLSVSVYCPRKGYFVAIFEDITNEVMMEGQIRQSQKMEAIGRLAGGIAHDFNNILFSILGYASLVKDDISEEKYTIRKNLDEVIKAGRRAKELVSQILAFSRKQEQEMKPVEARLIVKEAMKLMRATIPTSVEIYEEIDEEPRFILSDPVQIHQLIMNLCMNAVYAMRHKGGRLEVVLVSMNVDKEKALSHPNLKVGPYLKLTVKDTGQGMDKLIMSQMFEPFFTTKKVGEGSGMGLAMVHGIVASHGGIILVESEPQKGTTFEVLLPHLKSASPIAMPKEDAAQRGSERILLVDDEESIAHMGKQILERLGYKVVSETKSDEALNIFLSDPMGFDLVITDQMMPKMTGEDITRKILKARPGMPVIIMSGFSDTITEQTAREMGASEFVMKPVGPAELAEVTRRVLDKKKKAS